jgi:hypothetical protein
MAANGRLAGPAAEPIGGAASSRTSEGLRDQTPQPQTTTYTTTMRHIRIVHNADHLAEFVPAAQIAATPAHRRSGGVGGGPGKSGVLLDRSIQGQIGRMLRDAFSDVAKEPVPDRFVELLEALAAQEDKQ